MEIQLLKDKDIYPDDKTLSEALGKTFPLYTEFQQRLNDEFSVEMIWRYYNDGKAWLCKNEFKKKTVFWLSIWDGYFKTSFFFTEKNESGIKDLDIDEKRKKQYFEGKLTGKLKAFIIDVKTEKDLKEVYELIKYKKSIK